MEARFFATPAELRAWFEAHHADEDELVVGYYRKASGRGGITWQQSVDEALCFGWIDGIRRRLDEQSYSNRFTPRRKGSNWSAINIARARELIAEGRMTPPGLAAFEARSDDHSAIYSYEQRRNAVLDAEQEQRFRESPAAWEWFRARPPSFQRTAIHWVTSAKRPETRERRLTMLIEAAAEGRPPKPMQ